MVYLIVVWRHCEVVVGYIVIGYVRVGKTCRLYWSVNSECLRLWWRGQRLSEDYSLCLGHGSKLDWVLVVDSETASWGWLLRLHYCCTRGGYSLWRLLSRRYSQDVVCFFRHYFF